MIWKWAAFMPHPPIIVPDVGRGRENEASVTLDGIKKLTNRLADKKPDYMLVLSPHQPYMMGSLFINSSDQLSGSFAQYGAGNVTFKTTTPGVQSKKLSAYLASSVIEISAAEVPTLTQDQGSLVPLYWMNRVWGALPPIIFTSPIGLNMNEAHKLGSLLARFDGDGTWGLLASGDLSHRLTHNAPAGYSPFGKIFDKTIVEAFSTCDIAPLMDFPDREITDAGECGMRSALAMIGMCRALGGKIDVLSYEGPFGVGYCTALWCAEEQK